MGNRQTKEQVDDTRPRFWTRNTGDDHLASEPASTFDGHIINTRPSNIKQINDSVWELHKPHGQGIPEMDVIFFHGFQLSKDNEAFWQTWLSRDGTVIWPQVWLGECFPNARILSISYDFHVRTCNGQMSISPFQIVENLTHDIIWGSSCQAGQNCSVVLVGHCLGGIMIKEFLLKCRQNSSLMDRTREGVKIDQVVRFLKNCRGIFYYSTPHAGLYLPEAIISAEVDHAMAELFKVLSAETARINDLFSKLRHHPDLRLDAWAIGETLKTKFPAFKSFDAVVVPEASARHDVDWFYSAEADHFDVSRARNKSTCTIFTALCDFIAKCLRRRDQEDTSTTPVLENRAHKQASALGSVNSASDPDAQTRSAVGFLGNLAEKDNLDRKSKSKKAPRALEDLVNDLYNDNNRDLPGECAQYLADLACDNFDVCEKIVNFRGALAGLVRVVSKDSGSSPQGRSRSMRALACLSATDSDDLRRKIFSVPRVLEEVVNGLYSDDNRDLQEMSVSTLVNFVERDLWICWKITNFPGALAGLLGVLAKDTGGSPQARSMSMRVLACLSAEDSDDLKLKILSVPRALEELVGGLCSDDNRGLQEMSAQTLANFAKGNLEICWKIANFPGVRAGLVRLLAKDSGSSPQARSWSMTALACLSTQDSDDLTREILSVPRALEELVGGLCSDDNRGLQEMSARTLANFAKGNLEICWKIANFPGVLAGLVRLLAKDTSGSPQARSTSMRVLACLSTEDSDDLKLKILSVPRALEELVGGLCSDDNRGLQEMSAQTLANFAKGNLEICWKIANFPGVRAGLVRLLAKDSGSSPQARSWSMTALACLSTQDSDDLKREILSVPKALEELVGGLCSDDNRGLQEMSARTLANSAKGNLEICWKIANFPGVLAGLVRLLAKDTSGSPQARSMSMRVLACLSTEDSDDLKLKILSVPRALEELVGGLCSDDNRGLQEMSAQTLSNFAKGNLEICWKIANFPGVRAGLVRLLAKDSGSSPQARSWSMTALACLSTQDSDDLKREILSVPRALEELVGGLCSDDNRGLQEMSARTLANFAKGNLEICWKIANFPGVLAGLVRLLAKDTSGSPQARSTSMRVLACLSTEDSDELKLKILSVPRALEELVGGLCSDDNRGLQEMSAQTLANFAKGNLEICWKIANFPGVRAGLVRLLAKDNGSSPQARSWSMTALACLSTQDSDDLKREILSVPRALEELVGGLCSDDNRGLQEMSARTLANSAKGNLEICWKIANFPGVLAGLVRLLAKDTSGSPQAQSMSMRVLACLSTEDSDDLKLKILSVPRALEELVGGLCSDDNRGLQEMSAQTLANFAKGNLEICWKIANFPGVLAGFVRLLAKDSGSSPQARSWSMTALACLSTQDSDDLKREILSVPRALEELVGGLCSDDNRGLQEMSARTLANFAKGNLEICWKIANFPGVLAGLVRLLAKDTSGSPQARSMSMRVLACLSTEDSDDLKLKILSVPRALEELVGGLCSDDNRGLQEMSAQTLANFAKGNLEICWKIANFPGVRAGLVRLLTKDSGSSPQARSWSMTALACLSTQDSDDLKREILSVPRALEELVGGLCSDDNRGLQEMSAQTLANFAKGDLEICWKIANFPGALKGLVRVLAKDCDSTSEARRRSTRALAYLSAKDSDDLKWKIVSVRRALEEFVNGLYSDDNGVGGLQEMCAWTLANLACGDIEIGEKITRFSRALEGLVRVMMKDGSSSLDARNFSAMALGILASKNSRNLGWQIINAPRALEQFVNGLDSDNNRYLQEQCAKSFAGLASGDLEMCRNVGNFPGALAGLVKVLTKGSGGTLCAQKFGAKALANIALQDSRDLRWKIINAPRGLEALVNGLYSDNNRDLQEQCARAFANLACGELEIRRKIGDFPGVLAGLVRVLAEDSGSSTDAQKFSAKAVLVLQPERRSTPESFRGTT